MGVFRGNIAKFLNKIFHRENDRDKKLKEFLESKLLRPGFIEAMENVERHEQEKQKLEDEGLMLTIDKPILPRKLAKLLRARPNLNHLQISDVDLRFFRFSHLANLSKLKFVDFIRTKFKPEQLAKLTNVSQMAFDGIDFGELGKTPIIFPDSVNLLALDGCKGLGNLRDYNNFTGTLYISGSDFSEIDFVFPNLKSLSVSLTKDDPQKKYGSRTTKGLDYLKVGQEQPLDMGAILEWYPNLEYLTINGNEDSVLRFSNNIRSFDKLKVLTIRHFTGLSEIEAIQAEFPNVEELTITDSISSLQGLFKKFPNLKKLKIDSKIDDLSPLLDYGEKSPNLTILPEKDQFYKDEKFLRVSLRKLEQLGENKVAQQDLENLRIVIPEGFGENDSGINSFIQIIESIDKLTNKKNGQTKFEITSIPKISEEDKEKLASRYGLTFVYRIPIESQILHQFNITEAEDNLHGDEIAEIREELDSLASKMKMDGTLEEKVREVYITMQENLELQEITSMEDSGSDVFFGAEKKDDTKKSDLLTGLREKKVTPKAYICIANELLRRIGITDMRYRIKNYYMNRDEFSNTERTMKEVFGTTSPKMIEAGLSSSCVNNALQRDAKKARIHSISAMGGILEPEIIIPISPKVTITMGGRSGIRTTTREEKLIE